MIQAMLAEALDMLDYGLLVVDQEAQVGFLNRAAALVLAESQTLQLSSGGALTIRPRTLSAQVRKAIHGAGANQRVCGLRIPKTQTSAHRLALVFAPLLQHQVGGTPHRVAIWIADTDAAGAGNELLLSALFGLSPAEARLALGLAAGLTVEEYSGRAGVGIATVRSQLHSIFEKTGTRRQAALVALLLRVPALKLPPS